MANLLVKELDTVIKFSLGDEKEITISYYVENDKIGLLIEGYPNLSISPVSEDAIVVEAVD